MNGKKVNGSGVVVIVAREWRILLGIILSLFRGDTRRHDSIKKKKLKNGFLNISLLGVCREMCSCFLCLVFRSHRRNGGWFFVNVDLILVE